ncbi:MAG: HEAT repeat domain-containing protein, partial [Thermoanaerobaculum sp.]|nr:HEAT repeat domain-containing protein [Thermoanaerobaculum sp.]MDW7966878.1 HEAT repeat domain-containing protein [Thermoanaerobaculum sp.]
MRNTSVFGLCALVALPWLAPAADETLARLWQLGEVRSFDAEIYAAAAESPQVEVRRSCARLLGHLRNEGAVRLALRLSRDPAPMVRAEALASLGRLAPWLFQEPWKARVRKALGAGLKDQDLRVQEAAVWAWGAAGEAEEPFLEMLRHNQARSVRVAVLQNLWRTQGTQWPAVAARYAKSSQGELRWAALWSLSRKGGRELEATLPELLGDPQPAVRLLACEAVRRHKIAALAAQVVPLLGDPEESVRVAALNALAELGPEAAKVVTGKVVRDLPQWVANEDLQHPHLRVGAIRLAGSLGCCREQLERVVEEGGWAGGEAVVALARQQNRRLVEQELASPDAVFRRWAVLGLQYLAQSQELLQKAMGDEEARVRLAAAEVAGKLADPALAQPLRRLLEDRDAAVRVQAAESLAALGQPVEPALLVTMLKKELEGGASEGAVALIRLLGKAEPLSAEAASALEQARAHAEPGIALAAWEELFRHGRLRAFPNRRPRQPLSWYDELIRFCQKPRYLEVVTVRGTFTVSLDLADAPFAAFALWQLAGKKFFDNLTVHRVVSNFVVQGGDPRGDGWGGPGFFLPDELSLKPFEVGSVGMALAGPDTGGSQFFVTLTPQPH